MFSLSPQIYVYIYIYLKVLYGFFSFNVGHHIQGRHVIKLTSWASRYTTVPRMLTPFTNALYHQISGFKNLDAYILLDDISIWIWRATLVQLIIHEEEFSRPLDSFRNDEAHYCFEYDSSLTGSGLLISTFHLTFSPTPTLFHLDQFCGQAKFPLIALVILPTRTLPSSSH